MNEYLHRSRSKIRFILFLLAAVALLLIVWPAGSTSAANPEEQRLGFVDDPNPPPPPPDKVEAASHMEDDLVLRSSEPEDPGHEHSDDASPPDEPTGLLDVAGDSDIFACQLPDGTTYATMIHEPSPGILEAAGDYLVDQRAQDPSFMPEPARFEGPPPGCEPLEGKPSFEDFMADRTIHRLLNPDGSIKDLEQP